MADDLARDGYDAHYTEKLWSLLPEHHRHQDGLREPPLQLRRLLQILAVQLAITRRSHDRLGEDQCIELCDDWAVPYLADLVATRLVSALDTRARRIDVAKTIYYRRRKGTLRVLEELIGDIAGFEGTVIEELRRLARTVHLLDAPAAGRLGRFSGTPPGGTADLRSALGAEQAGGPFDEFHYTPDVRAPRCQDGRYAVTKLGVHLYRQRAYALDDFPLTDFGGGQGFTLDPAGREVPLFAPRSRAEHWDSWTAAEPWDLPRPIGCRLLNDARFAVPSTLLTQLVAGGLSAGAAHDLRRLVGVEVPGEACFGHLLAGQANGAELTGAANWRSLRDGALAADCGRAQLLPSALSVDEAAGVTVEPVDVVAGDLATWAASAPDRRLVVDPARGRFLFQGTAPTGPVTASAWLGQLGPLGAGTVTVDAAAATSPALPGLSDATVPDVGAFVLPMSLSHRQPSGPWTVDDLALRAAPGTRPYLRLAADLELRAPGGDAELVLDGLWLGGGHELVLSGDYKRVRLRGLTLDPGERHAGAVTVAPVGLRIEANIETLSIERCALGPLTVAGAAVVQAIRIEDSVLQDVSLGRAYDAPATEVTLARTTVLGDLRALRVWASEVLVDGIATVADTQGGCWRFSSARDGSRLPHPYEHHVLATGAGLFVSRRFPQPGYTQLADSAPAAIRGGAENGSEMGVWSDRLVPIREASLETKFEEYAPFGRLPILIHDT